MGTLTSTIESSPTPRISVVIPAHNAATTLQVPVASLRAQTFDDWEAIIVENNSVDSTSVVAEQFAFEDPRIRAISEPGTGVSAARNVGLAAARGDFVLFLDADDHIEPATFQLVADRLAEHPALDGVRFDWALQSTSGRLSRVSAWDLDEDGSNLFEVSQHHCPLAIHTCLMRRDILLASGGFDETLIAGEDWDLWQRLGRVGVQIGYIPEILAYYVLHAESATHRNFTRVLGDCLRAIDRLHEPDPRVKNPLPSYASGAPIDTRDATRRKAFLWTVALAIGSCAPVDDVLAAFPNPGRGHAHPDLIAETLHYSVPTGAGRTPEEWADCWAEVEGSLVAGLDALAAWDGDPALAPRVLRRIEARVVRSAGGTLVRAGRTATAHVDIDRSITDVSATSERLIVFVSYRNQPLGSVEVPVIDGVVAASLIRDAIIDQLGPTVARTLARVAHAYPRLAVGGLRAAISADTLRSVLHTRLTSGGHRRSEVEGLAKAAARRGVDRSSLAALGSTVATRNQRTSTSTSTSTGARPLHTWRAPRTTRLPILMYHQITDHGSAALAPYRVAPSEFEAQLKLLRQHGFESIGLDEWAETSRRGRSIGGRRVALTFDDGYCNVLDAAVPLLEEYGFSATFFVLPDQVGSTSEWDADFGIPAPLMSWDQIREARDRGFTIGSHSFSHRHLTALSPDETVERERESRAILAKELGIDACVVAYPYGDIDAAQRQTMAVAGYDVAVTTEHGFASRFDHPMALPRLDVTGTTTIDEFAALVGAASS